MSDDRVELVALTAASSRSSAPISSAVLRTNGGVEELFCTMSSTGVVAFEYRSQAISSPVERPLTEGVAAGEGGGTGGVVAGPEPGAPPPAQAARSRTAVSARAGTSCARGYGPRFATGSRPAAPLPRATRAGLLSVLCQAGRQDRVRVTPRRAFAYHGGTDGRRRVTFTAPPLVVVLPPARWTEDLARRAAGPVQERGQPPRLGDRRTGRPAARPRRDCSVRGTGRPVSRHTRPAPTR